MKKISVLLTGILICVCVLSSFFSAGCDYDDTKPKYLYDENGVTYLCFKDTNTAKLYEIKEDEFSAEDGIWIIPEKLSNGMTVTGIYDFFPYSWHFFAHFYSDIIKKVYFPYTFNGFVHTGAFHYGGYTYEADDGSSVYMEERWFSANNIVVPCINADYYTNWGNKWGTPIQIHTSYIANFFKSTMGVIMPEEHFALMQSEMEDIQAKIADENFEKDENGVTKERYVELKALLESLNHDLYTPNYIFHFNYEDAPNENIYWIDRIEDENTLFVLPTNPIRDGYEFGGWYTEELCENEWDKQMLPTESVKHFYAKWVEKAE